MSDTKFYPSLATLVNLENIPSNIFDLENKKEDILKGLFCKNININVSKNGESKSYLLTILSYNQFGVLIPNTEIALKLNPTTNSENTEFDIKFKYKLEILKYINSFELDKFQGDNSSFFDIITKIAQVNASSLLKKSIDVFVIGTSFEEKVGNFIAEYNNDNPNNIITVSSDYDIDIYVQNIVNAYRDLGLNTYSIIFERFLLQDSIELFFENTQKLFIDFIGFFSLNTIKKLITPYVEASINDIKLALEFPRKYLIPIDDFGNEISDTAQSQLQFHVGSLEFSSEIGFDFINQDSFTFTRSLIGKTGLSLYFNNAKIDLRKDRNIEEATAAGYPDDFVGVFIGEAEIGLPAKLNENGNKSTAVIKGTNLLIGTGGFSGTIGMEKKDPDDENAALIKADIGDMELALEAFDISFYQNAITESNIHGHITLPSKLTTQNNEAVIIDILASFDAKGNFEISALNQAGIDINFFNVFNYKIQELTVGRLDERYYLETSGVISFQDSVISDILKAEIGIQNLRIWDDGKIEIEGGSLAMPEGVSIEVGPAKIFITAISFGSIQKEVNGVMRKYNYWCFDGGVSLDPGGVDARGTGIKYCYSVDHEDNPDLEFDSYLAIESIYLDLVIPGKASPEEAAVLISGWLTISQETLTVDNGEDLTVDVYSGGIDLILPKMKLAAGVDMKYTADIPAWIVDATLALPKSIPLGSTGLGIYGFVGLFGQRYVATKEAAGLQDTNTWYDYYKADPLGVKVQKFETPFQTGEYENSFSAGAGALIGTTADDGKAFSSKLFLLLSLPEVFILEGKANIMGEKVGFGTSEPPFYAFLAISKDSVEAGFGAKYKMPEDTGDIIDVYGDVNLGFFFHNPKAWYIHIGTREKPITARMLSFFNAQAYLAIAAKGIEAGAKTGLDFTKKYIGGALRAHVDVYIETGGFISFEKPQIGAYAALGGSVDVSICGFGFFLGIDTSLAVEAPKPFKIEGSVDLTVGFKILCKEISKSFTVHFVWEKSKLQLQNPIYPIDVVSEEGAAIARNMMSNELFTVKYLGEGNYDEYAVSDIGDTIIPIDSFIDIKFTKPLNPTKVLENVGGGANAQGYIESVPPEPVNYSSTHNYSIENIQIYANDGQSGWLEYIPFEAMLTPEALEKHESVKTKQLGFWQIEGEGQYNAIRLLAQSAFSYMDNGLKGWANPEKYGITGRGIYCIDLVPEIEYSNWENKSNGDVINSGQLVSKNHAEKKVSYRVYNGIGKINTIQNSYDIDKSLFFPNKAHMKFYFFEPSAFVSLKLFTYSAGVTVRFVRRSKNEENEYVFTEHASITKTRSELVAPVMYEDAESPVNLIYIEPFREDKTVINDTQNQIQTLVESLYESNNADRQATLDAIAPLLGTLETEQTISNSGDTLDSSELQAILNQLSALLSGYETARDNAYAEVSRLEELLDAANSKIDNCCLSTPSTKPTQQEICIDNLEDIAPVGTPLTDVENEYNIYITNLETLASGITNCKSNYTTNYNALCSAAHGYVQKIQDKITEYKTIALENEELANSTLEYIGQYSEIIGGGGSYPVPEGIDGDNTVVHQIEWQSLNDYIMRTGAPGYDAVEANYQESIQAINNSLSPIWRPNTNYIVSLELTDNLNFSTHHTKQFNFGFKTVGPVGFFHEGYDANKAFGDKYAKPITAGSNTIELLKYKLTTLRDYIDYKRSYPNADGNLLQAKPLFYQDTELHLLYKYSYVFHMLNSWPRYSTENFKLPNLDGYLEVVVKDPLEEVEIPNPPPADVETQYIPRAILNWDKDDKAPIPYGISASDIMRNPELYNPDFTNIHGKCWSDGSDKIRPAHLQTVVTLQFLRPSTLYTAIFYNNFEGNRREVHRYVFQTSRYASLNEQINSYKIEEEDVQKQAIFDLPQTITSNQLSLIKNLIQDRKSGDNSLDSLYVDPFDCIIEGVMQMRPLPPAQSTEINKVLDKTGKVIGIILRSPEPFIDPKIPVNKRSLFCKLVHVNDTYSAVEPTKLLFSKDCSQIFISNKDYNIAVNQIRLQIAPVIWDGSDYIQDKENKFATDNITINNL